MTPNALSVPTLNRVSKKKSHMVQVTKSQVLLHYSSSKHARRSCNLQLYLTLFCDTQFELHPAFLLKDVQMFPPSPSVNHIHATPVPQNHQSTLEEIANVYKIHDTCFIWLSQGQINPSLVSHRTLNLHGLDVSPQQFKRANRFPRS